MVERLLAIAANVHRWRVLTVERRCELILQLDDLLSDVQRLEARVAELESKDGARV